VRPVQIIEMDAHGMLLPCLSGGEMILLNVSRQSAVVTVVGLLGGAYECERCCARDCCLDRARPWGAAYAGSESGVGTPIEAAVDPAISTGDTSRTTTENAKSPDHPPSPSHCEGGSNASFQACRKTMGSRGSEEGYGEGEHQCHSPAADTAAACTAYPHVVLGLCCRRAATGAGHAAGSLIGGRIGGLGTVRIGALVEVSKHPRGRRHAPCGRKAQGFPSSAPIQKEKVNCAPDLPASGASRLERWLATRMVAEWTWGRAFKAECGKGASESSSYSLERSEGEKIRGGIRGGLSLRQRAILAGLASVIITLSASAGGARSNNLMSSFPDPGERPHASKGGPAKASPSRVSPPSPHTFLPQSRC
jgi:hypothetical protein